jgi:hypothetical protein
MSFDNDNMIGTIPPGFLAPADGNYAPNAAQGASPAVAVVSDARRASDESDLDAEATVGARHAVPVLSAAVDLGPNNKRLEDVKPELVNALRELVRQYRQEGIVARRHEIRRIRQARLDSETRTGRAADRRTRSAACPERGKTCIERLDANHSGGASWQERKIRCGHREKGISAGLASAGQSAGARRQTQGTRALDSKQRETGLQRTRRLSQIERRSDPRFVTPKMDVSAAAP